MICLHCGLCCIQFDVVIISTEYAGEGLDVENYDTMKKACIIKKGGDVCPHLYWEGDESRCKIHHYSWFGTTPCHDFGQIESSPGQFCRSGVWSIQKLGIDYWKKEHEKFKNIVKTPDQFCQQIEEDLRNDRGNISKNTARSIL